MLAPALDPNEDKRLEALQSLQLLDSAPEERFDTLTRVAARVFDAPIAVVTLVDSKRQWFKSCLGLDVSQTPREISFCGHAILGDDLFLVEDAKSDERFADNPLVTGPPHIRFYAGVPLEDEAGFRVGTIAVIDSRPRTLSEDDRSLLADLGRLAELELMRIRVELQHESDAAQLRRQEVQLREADLQKDRFLATLAHELRNPLAPIRTSVHVAKLTRPENRAVVRALDVIDRQSVHLSRLVDDLLEIARITQGRVVLDRRPCAAKRLAAEAFDAVAAAAQASRHALRLDVPADDCWIDADPTRIVQALQNLLYNAVKFTDPGGHVTLRVACSADHVELEVEDDGIGISPDQFERLFEPFAQDHRTLMRRSGGLGIGLALARRLVEMHGGTLEAFSPGPQLGARFVLRLPRIAEPSAAAAGAPPAPLWRPRRVLIVDDNVDLLSSLQELLEAHGHVVYAADSGRGGIEAAVQHPLDVVLLDIGLPDMDGHAVATELKRRLGPSCPPLIAVTGWGQADDRRRSAESGFSRHLTKPVDPEVLESVLAGLD